MMVYDEYVSILGFQPMRNNWYGSSPLTHELLSPVRMLCCCWAHRRCGNCSCYTAACELCLASSGSMVSYRAESACPALKPGHRMIDWTDAALFVGEVTSTTGLHHFLTSMQHC